MYKLIDLPVSLWKYPPRFLSCPLWATDRVEPQHRRAGGEPARLLFATSANNSGVIIRDDLPSKRRRFLIVENRHERYVHISVPLSDIPLHGSNVVRFEY